MEKLPIKGKYSQTHNKPSGQGNHPRRYSNTHLPIIPQQINVKNDQNRTKYNPFPQPSAKEDQNNVPIGTDNSGEEKNNNPLENKNNDLQKKKKKEKKLEKPKDKDIVDLDRKATPKFLIDEQMNVNMSIPPERKPGEEPLSKKVPEPTICLPRPFRRDSGVTKKIVKRKYPSDSIIRRNLVNYRNVKIRTLLLEYLGSKEHKKSMKKDFSNLGNYNLVNFKKNYVMLLGDLLQVIGLICIFLAFITDDFMKIFFAVFFSDFLHIALFVFRLNSLKKKNKNSIHNSLGVLEYGFHCYEILMTLLIITKDMCLYFSFKNNSAFLFLASVLIWIICVVFRFVSLKFDSYYSTTVYTYIMFSIQFYLICTKVIFEIDGGFGIWFIPFYIYLTFPGIVYFIMLIAGFIVMFQRKEEGEFSNKRILAFYSVLQALEFSFAYVLVFLFKNLEGNNGAIKWFFFVLIPIKLILFYMNFRFTEDFIFG